MISSGLIWATLYALSLQQENPVLIKKLIKESSKRIVVEAREESSKEYLSFIFGKSMAAMHQRIAAIESESDLVLIRLNYVRSHWVHTKKARTFKWIYEVTEEGMTWVRSNMTFFAKNKASIDAAFKQYIAYIEKQNETTKI